MQPDEQLVSEDTLCDFVDLCMAVRYTKPSAERPLVWAYDRMTRHWDQVGPDAVDLETAMCAMVLAWELARTIPREAVFNAKLPFHETVDTWIRHRMPNILEMVCRWAMDNYTDPVQSHKMAAVIMGNLATASSWRRSHDPEAQAVLELLRAGHLPVHITAMMIRQLTPADEKFEFEPPAEVLDQETQSGDIVHLAVRGVDPRRIEYITVCVTQADGEACSGYIASDPTAPAMCGHRKGDGIEFTHDAVHRRIHRQPKYLQ